MGSEMCIRDSLRGYRPGTSCYILYSTTTNTPSNSPILGLGSLLIRLCINIIIIDLIEGIRAIGLCGIGEGKKSLAMVIGENTATLHLKHLHLNAKG